MFKLLVLLMFVTFKSNASDYIFLECNSWGNDKTFELKGELDESGSNFLDGYLDIKAYDQGKLVFDKKRIDSTGFFWIDEVRGQPVYLAELVPINRVGYSFLSIAANHPIQSGNSHITINNIKYLAECTTSYK